MKKYMAEMLGVMFFVLIIGLSGDPLTIGIGLAILTYATASYSGAHLNPAVTLSLLIGKRMKSSEAINYRFWQIVGGILGALLYRLLIGNTMLIIPADGVSLWRVFLGEFIFTFALATVVYNVVVMPKTPGNSYWGAAIGLTVFVGAMCVGKMTGGVFNPAVAIGPIVVDALHGGISLGYLWIYLLATLLGGAVAGGLMCCAGKHMRME